MSTNAIFCISNTSRTVRLSAYRCKPTVFLTQLIASLSEVGISDFDEIIMHLIDHGFELESESSTEFTAKDMNTSLLVNWAWLLNLNTNTLQYWDVTAALNSMQKIIEQESISPMDYSNWIANDAQQDYQNLMIKLHLKLKNLGITISHFE